MKYDAVCFPLMLPPDPSPPPLSTAARCTNGGGEGSTGARVAVIGSAKSCRWGRPAVVLLCTGEGESNGAALAVAEWLLQGWWRRFADGEENDGDAVVRSEGAWWYGACGGAGPPADERCDC